MASSPQSTLRDPADFRAPPPSPIAGSRRTSSVANEDVLTDFLHHSLRIPDLVLPDRLFPRLLPSDIAVPAVDFHSLTTFQSPEALKMARDALESTGCFQLLNYGISLDTLQAAVCAADGIFQLPLATKKAVERSSHHMQGFGFEEVLPAEGEDDYYEGDIEFDIDEGLFEEFVWCNDSGLTSKMEQIWPDRYSIFRERMERVSSAIEEVSRGIIKAVKKVDDPHSITARGEGMKDFSWSSVCHIYRHPKDIPVERCISSFRCDVIRMMIRGSDYPHALSLHVVGEGCSEFHVYSKKGWVSFTPAPNSLVVTAGDQIQGWSGGQYKHVIGRPIYRGGQQGNNNSISMAFLCSPCTSSTGCTITAPNHNLEENQLKMITLHQQAIFAVLFSIACQFLLFVFHNL